MSKRSKLILYAIIIGLIITVFAIIFIAGKNSEKTSRQAPEFNHKTLAENYQNQVRTALDEFINSEKVDELSVPEASGIKNKLLKLVNVPAEFKDLHLNLVLGLTEIEDSLLTGSAQLLNQGREKIKNSLSGYPWLEQNE